MYLCSDGLFDGQSFRKITIPLQNNRSAGVYIIWYDAGMRIRVGVIVFVLMLLGGVVFFATRTGTSDGLLDLLQEAGSAPVALVHTYEDGEHVFTGTRDMATPCDQVSAEALVREDGSIELVITETPADAMCLLRKTTMSFSAQVAAPEDAEISVLVNGEPVEVIAE